MTAAPLAHIPIQPTVNCVCPRYESLKLKYVVTPTTLTHAKPSMMVLHPLPRVGEIDPACDQDPRAAYFRQVSSEGSQPRSACK